MKFEKVTHYVENSYDYKPSFKIEMGDGKIYISNGCEFVEDTTQNRQYLIDEYHCQSYLEELDNSPIDSHDSITDASFMMLGCEDVTEFEWIALNLKSAVRMMYRCDNVVNFKLVAPKLIKTRYMMRPSDNLVNFELIAPNLKDDYKMKLGCKNIENFELVAPPHIMEKYKHLLNKR